MGKVFFREIDILVSISRISFDKNYTQALLILGVSYESLNGFTSLVYLEKKYDVWKKNAAEF
ncbi:MAG: hypothetical protein ACK5H1_07035 [Tenacibaculum sp.]